MESNFVATAAYIPSQPGDIIHQALANALNPSSGASLPSSSFTAEPATYNISQPQPSTTSRFYLSPAGIRFPSTTPFTPPTQMDGLRIPTTTAPSHSTYDAMAVFRYQNSSWNYVEQQPFPSSQPPTSPPATMQAYPINNPLGAGPNRFPYIRPMPAEGLSENALMALPHRPKIPIELAARTSPREAQPANVVGLQGRRGILPSAVGRPAAVAGEIVTGQKSANMPVKDANGKYACQHCVKVYLHAKHLKRHLLRHTGTRPYSCGLCKETFSRSDILKRHFQKCSVRRGNPTGENHLTHSRATKRSNLEAAGRVPRGRAVVLPLRTQSLPSSQTNEMGGEMTLNNVQEPFDFNALELGSPSFPEGQQPLSNRDSSSNNVRRPSTGGVGGQVSNLYVSAPSSYDPTGVNYSGQITPDSITTSGAATPYQYPHELRANQFSSDTPFTPGIPVPVAQSMPSSFGAPLPHIVGSSHDRGNDHDLDWAMFFPARGLDNYAQPPFHTVDDSELLYHTVDDSSSIKLESDSTLVSPPDPPN